MRFSIGPLPTTLVEGMMLILAAVWIVRKSHRHEWGEYGACLIRGTANKLALGCMGLFFLAGVVSVFISPVPIAALGLWRAYFLEPMLFFFILLDSLRSKEFSRAVMISAVASAVSIAWIAVTQRITGVGIPVEWAAQGRMTSIYPYPNAVGLYVAPLVPFAIVLFLASRSRVWRVAYGAAIPAMFAAIFFAQTEAALGALAISLFLFALLYSSRSRIAACSIAAVVIAGLIASPTAVSFLKTKLLLKDWSGKVRRGIWTETNEMLKDYWLLGAGLAGYKEVFPKYHVREYVEVFQYPHSIFLNFWTETGVAGVASFLALLGMFFYFALMLLRRSRLLPRSDDAHAARVLALALTTSMITILLHGLVDVPYFKNDLAMQFWLLFALVWGSYQAAVKNAAA